MTLSVPKSVWRCSLTTSYIIIIQLIRTTSNDIKVPRPNSEDHTDVQGYMTRGNYDYDYDWFNWKNSNVLI